MSKLARSSRVEDEADIVYTISTPFQSSDSKILLLTQALQSIVRNRIANYPPQNTDPL